MILGICEFASLAPGSSNIFIKLHELREGSDRLCKILQRPETLGLLLPACRIYKLRITSDPANLGSSPKIVATIPARCLAAAGLVDHLQASQA